MKHNVIILAVCQALMMSGNSLLITATALVGLRIASQPQWATIPFALMFAGVIITTYPASMMMQRVGRKAGFTLGAMLGIIGGIVSAWSITQQSFLWFCVGSILLGSFNAFGQYYRFAAAEAAGDHFRSRAISYVLAGGVLAAFIGPNLAKLTRELLPVEFSGSYACIALIYCCSLFLIQGLQLKSPDKKTTKGDSISLLDVVCKPHFITAVASGMVGYGVMNLLMTATPVTMRVEAFTDNNIARVIQWHVVGMFAPGFFTGSLIQRYGVVRIIVTGSALLLVSVIVALSGDSFAHFFVALFLLGVGWNFAFTGGTVLLTEVHTPSERAKVQGMNDFILFTGLALSSLSAGMIYFFFGWMWVNLATAPLILAILVPAIWLRSVRRKYASGPSSSPRSTLYLMNHAASFL